MLIWWKTAASFWGNIESVWCFVLVKNSNKIVLREVLLYETHVSQALFQCWRVQARPPALPNLSWHSQVQLCSPYKQISMPSPAPEFETSSQHGLLIIDGCFYQQGAPHMFYNLSIKNHCSTTDVSSVFPSDVNFSEVYVVLGWNW